MYKDANLQTLKKELKLWGLGKMLAKSNGVVKRKACSKTKVDVE